MGDTPGGRSVTDGGGGVMEKGPRVGQPDHSSRSQELECVWGSDDRDVIFE